MTTTIFRHVNWAIFSSVEFFVVVVACLALCYPFDVYFYKCFEEKKWMHPTRRWILTGKSFHRSFAERFMNCRIEVFFLFFVSFSFHLTSSLAPSIQCDKYRKWNWWAQKRKMTAATAEAFIVSISLYALILAFVFIHTENILQSCSVWFHTSTFILSSYSFAIQIHITQSIWQLFQPICTQSKLPFALTIRSLLECCCCYFCVCPFSLFGFRILRIPEMF